MNDCRTCRWFIPMRMITKAEAKRVHMGEYIETRGCLWNICRYENKFDKKENK